MSRIRVVATVHRAQRAGAEALGDTETKEVTGVSDKPEYADWRFVAFGIVLVVIGAWLGSVLAELAPEVDYTNVNDGLSRFTILFVLALAMERLVNPLSHLNIPNPFAKADEDEDNADNDEDNPDNDKKRRPEYKRLDFGGKRKDKIRQRDEGVREARNKLLSDDQGRAQDAADGAANDDADQQRIGANTQVVIWAVAAFLSMLVSGALGVYLTDIFGLRLSASSPERQWLDAVNVAITGLVIGAGTDPLNSLIQRVKKPEEEPGDSPNT